jgi:ATP/maltotriose-dependent transcriptional regulator MalT
MREAFESSQKNQEKYAEGRALIWIGRIGGKSEKKEESQEAEDSLLQGIRIFEALRTRPSLSLGNLFLGELYVEKGRNDEALEMLKRAKAMFEEMGMVFWVAKAKEILAIFL